MKGEGYKAVISLLHPAVVPFEPKLLAEERENLKKVNLPLIHLPMLPWVSDNEAALDSIRSLIKKGPDKYYVHCYLGKDRVNVVRNLVSRFAGPVAPTEQPISRRRLAEFGNFERGPIVVLEDSVYLTPYPTDEEMLAFFLTGEVNTVVCLMDSTKEADRVWIEKERSVLQKHGIPYYNLPVSTINYDPERVLEVARKVRKLPRPVAVHGFLGRGPRWEAFIQAYRSNLPPTPPVYFREPLQKGPARVLAPNIATGPRPAGPEFGTRLYRAGIRKVIFVGEPDSLALHYEKAAAAEGRLSWEAHQGKLLELLQLLSSGGPWYIYGPKSGPVAELIAHDFGPAIPERMLFFKDSEEIVETAPQPEGWLNRWLKFVPDLYTIIMFSPPLMLYAVLAAAFAGWLRSRKNVRTPYTRKVFHLFIFSMASFIQFTAGLPVVALFGVLVGGAVFYAIFRADDFPFYEAMARPTDAPHRTLFIVIPFFTTALGGVLSNLFFGNFASIGYLVGGWGDAVGEPVGTRWGKHKYSVPSLAGVPATRSLEGSSAVILVGMIVAYIGIIAMGFSVPEALLGALLCAISGAVVEAFSNHGLDNLTIQVAASGMAWWLLG
ncbi:MAG: hypothetical protein Kow0037_09870 [Calditrichia bacterium]